MRTTGKFDVNGKEIFEGDKVIFTWGWFTWKEKPVNQFQIHTITVNPAYMMNNGEMHDDGNGIIFCLGKSYNSWKGENIAILTEEEIKKIGMPEDTNFFFDDDDKAIRFTDQNFFNISDEDWKKILEKRKQEEYDLWFGPQSIYSLKKHNNK